MTGFRQLRPLFACFLVLTLPLTVIASSIEVPPAHTGGFGEPDCTACHFDNELRHESSNLALVGLPETYRPGATYTLEVRLVDPHMRAGAFLLSARAAGTDPCGSSVGTLKPADARTEALIAGSPPVEYLRSLSTSVTLHPPRTGLWTFTWTAAEDGVSVVVFHLAANAGNGDESPLGDHIYRLEIRLRPARHP